MSTEENKAVIRRYFDMVWNQGKVDAVHEFVAENVLAYDATDREPRIGFESVKQVVILFHSAFPDMQCPLHDLLADGDKVVARWSLHGTQRGAFMGAPASGKTVNVTGIVIYRLENCKIVEYWGNFATLGLMKQVGAKVNAG